MNEQSRFTNFDDGIVFEPARDLHWTQNDVVDASVSHADALSAVAKLNQQAFGGFTDWRLPTAQELLSIVDYSRTSPAFDTTAFPNTPSEWFWTSTGYADDEKNYAWIVNGRSGYSDFNNRDLSYRVRAVRGPARQ